MREQGVRGLSVACLNHGCRHELIFSADDYPVMTIVRILPEAAGEERRTYECFVCKHSESEVVKSK